MNTTILNFKTDPETKAAAKVFAESLGISVSALLNAQLKQTLRDRKITLSDNLEPTPYLVELIREAEEDLKAGKNMSKPMNKKELLTYLASL